MILLFVVVIFFSCSAAFDFDQFSSSATISDNILSIDTKTWLSKINDDKKISELSIPGTHDSCATKDYGSAGWTQCQEQGITYQLENGVRFLDIRIHKDLNIYHGIKYLHISFDEVLDEVSVFLEKYKSEFVILSIKDENDSGGVDSWSALVTKSLENNSKSLVTDASKDFSVKELRGKFITFRRFGTIQNRGLIPPGWPDNANDTQPRGSTPAMMFQDVYSKHKNDYEIKWNYVKSLLTHSNQNRGNEVFYINFLSASLDSSELSKMGKATPFLWAKNMNVKMIDYLAVNPKTRCGVVMIDFLNRSPVLSKQIIYTNF